MSLVKPSDYSGGAYFKPLEHMNDLALLVEPVRIDKDVPNEYQGRKSVRDEVTCTISVFANSDALNKGEPTQVIKQAKVVHGMLTDTLSKIIGQATIATVAKIPTKSGSGYVWRDPSAEATAAVTAYYEGRAAAEEAAIADAPSFDD